MPPAHFQFPGSPSRLRWFGNACRPGLTYLQATARSGTMHWVRASSSTRAHPWWTERYAPAPCFQERAGPTSPPPSPTTPCTSLGCCQMAECTHAQTSCLECCVALRRGEPRRFGALAKLATRNGSGGGKGGGGGAHWEVASQPCASSHSLPPALPAARLVQRAHPD